MKRWLPHPLLTPLLALIWLLLNNTRAPGHVVLGLLLGWAIPWFTLSFWPEAVRVRHPMALLRFAAFFVLDILKSNLIVARLVLLGPKALHPMFVVVPLHLHNELALSLLANTLCLTPGTVSARLSGDHRQLLVHALHCTDPAQVIHTIQNHFERPLMEMFEC